MIASILLAGSSLAQITTGDGIRFTDGTNFTTRAASARQITLHVSFRLRNRKALAKLLSDLQDPASPKYHRWLTPPEFDAQFGRTPAEVNAVSQWLSSHGLKVMSSSNREIVSAIFAPSETINTGALIISSNDPTRPTAGVSLSGSGLAGKLSAASSFTISGSVGQTIQANLNIKNTGKGLLSGDWSAVSILPYRVDPGHFNLQPGMSTNIPISFLATSKGEAPSVALAIEVIAPSTRTKVVTLKGMGR